MARHRVAVSVHPVVEKIEEALHSAGARSLSMFPGPGESLMEFWSSGKRNFILQVYPRSEGAEVWVPLTAANRTKSVPDGISSPKVPGLDLAEAILAQRADGLDRSGFILAEARKFMEIADPENATLKAAVEASAAEVKLEVDAPDMGEFREHFQEPR